MRNARFWLAAFALTLATVVVWSQPAGEEPSAEEQREKAIIDRFRKVLETNPRRGTALDRIYGYHVERGSLDALVGEYRERTKKDAADGTSWMIVALLESQRGRDAAAVDAFRQAETYLPQNAMPGYYLGQSLVLVGQPDAAAEAFERAIVRKPNRTDLLDLFQALGRVYQRAQRTDKALGVWARLEQLFPDDARVQEQIATTLVEEGQYEQALPRLEKLAKQTQDRYRQATFLMEAAELKVRLKQTPKALADFEAILGQLNPESWLYRDVRRRVEEVFLRSDDLAGLAKYYEEWIKKNPEDIEAIARLARTLSSQGRLPEARTWLQKGIDVAPGKKELRQALIDQLVYEQKYAEAAKEYEALDKVDPNNPDLLREWGKLLARDSSKPEAERKAAAVAIWKRLLERKPNDPVSTAQVADLVRTSGLTDEALALYRKAIELAPTAPQYREYLGEYLHSLKRSEEALAVWRPIAEGANRNAKNLARLAEVLAGFGYRKEAVAALDEALQLEKDDFGLLLTYAEQLHQDGQNEKALVQLDAATKLMSGAEEAESVLQAQIKIYQAMDTLTAKAEELQKELDAGKEPTADRWHRLARYYEANRQAAEATTAIVKALEKDAKSIPLLTAAARIHENGGNFLAAADTYRKLAGIDRRFRTEHLTAVANLEQRLGRRDQALQAGRDLLAAAPGNPEHYKFYAQLCFQLGDPEEGIESLRRSVRANPSEPQGLLTLAGALGERLRTGEAIELLWRAFEKTTEMEGKLSVIDQLTELYLQNNQFDRLMERLERERREADKAREMTLCIAQAYQKAGDLGTARQQLERLLTEHTRDTALLLQLSQLAEAEGDLASATKYQRQMTTAAPNNRDGQLRLAQLLVKSGEGDEAAEIWVKLVAGEPEPHRNLQAIDQLMAHGKHETVLAILARLLAQKPGDWELLYREGATLGALHRNEEATRRFEAILQLKLNDDEQGAVLKAQKKSRPKTATAAATMLRATPDIPDVPLVQRTQNIWEIRAFTGLEEGYYYYTQQQRIWTPRDFGQARMAAIGWLLAFVQKTREPDQFIKRYRDAKDRPNADLRARWDWFYLQSLRQDARETYEIAKVLAQGNDPAGQLAFLNALPSRGQSSGRSSRSSNRADNLPPLPADLVELMLASYRKLRLQKPEWASAAIAKAVQDELKRAKRADEGDKLYRETLAAANSLPAVREALTIAAGRGDVDNVASLFDRLEKLQGPPKSGAAQLATRTAYSAIGQAMAQRVEEKAFPDVLRLLDVYLASMRRLNLATPKSLSSSRTQTRTSINVPMFTGGTSVYRGRGSYLDFPVPNDYFDEGSIILLRNALEMYKKADLLSDLFAHVRRQAETAPASEHVYHRLALGYLHWWNDEKDEALQQLTAAATLVPGDLRLAIEVAGLREKNNEPEAALAMLDAITPLDHNIMQQREQAALRLAERTGNVQRAREAAERLFGLRLNAETQVDLAGKMHRLGMHQLAETVLGRAQRQAGSRTGALVSLMTQYQGQNQSDMAVQIARVILRKGPSVNFQPYRGYESGDGGRDQAIQVIARSGQLKEMIERAEAQLKSSPKSLQIHQALLDYYRAAGDKEKFKTTAARMADLKPDDGKLRYQVAQQLQRMGDKQAAVEHYAKAIRLEPAYYADRYWEINQLFQEANKYEELTKIFDEIDLRKSGGNYWAFMEIIQPLFENEATRAQGMKLFRKAWEAFPTQRVYLLSSLYRDEVWRLPETYAYVRQGMLPAADGLADPWRGCEEIMSYGGDGRTTGLVTRMFEIARRQNRFGSLRKEIEQAFVKHPEWIAGKALLAIIDLQTGRVEQAKKAWRELLDDKKNPMPAVARFLLAQELENYSSMEQLALETLESGAEELMNDMNMEFSYSPIRRLVRRYQDAGRKDDAKALSLKCLRMGEYISDPGYTAYRRINNYTNVGNDLLQQGDPVGAVRVFNEILGEKDTLAAAAAWNSYGQEAQAEAGVRRAMKALKPEALPDALRGLLTPRQQPRPNQGVLDLILVVEPRELGKAALTSMFDAAVRATAKAPDVRKEATVKLTELLAQHPKDCSVLVAAALVALSDKAATPSKALERLVQWLEANPLEELPAGVRANSRQRAAAFEQVGLWLVGRECLKQEALRTTGEKLGARALAAARRQLDPLYAIAILREWGQADLDRGNRESAEARWAQMLELVLPAPAKPKQPVRGAGASALDWHSALVMAPGEGTLLAQAPLALPAPPLRAPASGGPSTLPVVTTDQFTQAVDLARLAAEKKLTALSLRAMRDALRGGPPVPAAGSERRPQRIVYTASGERVVSGGVAVDSSVAELVRLWRKEGVPAADIYAVLAEVVLPDLRPAEVFLYDPATSDLAARRGVGHLLVETAVQANRIDDLRKRAQPRTTQPLGELPARVLLTHAALAAKQSEVAADLLKTLGERLQKDTLQTTAELIGTVAATALEQPATAGVALPLVERAAKNLAAGNAFDAANGLFFRVAKHHLDARDEAAARKTFKEIEDVGQRGSVRNEGYRRQLATRLAQEYLRVGWLAECLAEVGRQADIPASSNPRARPAEPVLPLLVPIASRLLALPAAERYQLLEEWTMTTPARRSIRFVAAEVPHHIPPASFGSFRLPTGGAVSNVAMLLDAAREAGKLDELAARVDTLVKEKAENADTVRFLVSLAQGKGAALDADLKTHLADVKRRATEAPVRPVSYRYYYPDDGNQVASVRWADYLVARACLGDTRTMALGEQMLEALLGQAQRTHSAYFNTHTRRGLLFAEATRRGAPSVLQSVGLPRWYNASARSVWAAEDGHVAHLASDQPSFLLFDCPLSGTFEFSVDAYQGGWAEGHAGYGGIVFEPNREGVSSSIWAVSKQDTVVRVAEGIRTDDYNRLTVQVEPGKVRCLLNGQLFYEDTDAAPTSPWLMLVSQAGRKAVFRNFALTGKPTVLREVPLTQGDYLEGWMTHVYSGILPPRMAPKEPKPPEPDEEGVYYGPRTVRQTPPKPVYDWRAKDGEILGRKLDDVSKEPVPSKLAYFRPLRAGEKVRYEFWYKPGEMHVHPSLGRLAFLLEPDGVRLHWLSDRAKDDWTGLAADNAVDEPGTRRGSGKLPLKPDAWNSLLLTMTDDRVTLELNGEAIYERNLEEQIERLFGLFHYRDRTGARVRNAVLTGTWQQLNRLEDANLEAKAATPVEARVRRALIGEQTFGKGAALVLRQARELPPPERYRLLADWVLPGESRPVFQLAGEFVPLDGAGTSASTGRRVLLGNRFDSPALELVKVAGEIGKLDELAGRIDKVSVAEGNVLDQRCKLALLALVRAAQGRDADAVVLVGQLPALVKKLPLDAPLWQRWPEFVAGVGCLERPGLHAAALTVLEATMAGLRESLNKKVTFPDREEWLRAVRHVHARALVLTLPEGQRRPFGSDPGLAQWAPVSRVSADSRSKTGRIPHWTARIDTIWHYPGHNEDYLYLRTPLLGDFEVSCELTTFGWREARILYGGLRFQLLPSRKEYELHALGQPVRKVPFEPALPALGDWYRYRLVVKDGTFTVFVNDRQLCEEPLPYRPDPWLGLFARHDCTAGFRNLRISGQPTVPEKLDLSNGFDLTGWLAYQANWGWQKRGEEIYNHGVKPPVVEGRSQPPRRYPEAALHYHRPLLEDGEVEYEFYYQADKAHVHPMLDRVTFLLEPDGVRIHRLTDGALDRSGLGAGNVADEPNHRRGPAKLPLQEKQWNRVKLSAVGDDVIVSLNGVEIYRRPIEATNQRLFGLFHYTDATEARVRGVTYRGEWSKRPPVQDELLSALRSSK